MSLELEELNRQQGIRLATHVWGTTVASVPLIAAPPSGRRIVLHYIVTANSANGSTRLTNGTSAATTHWIYPGAGAHAEEARVECDDATGLTIHTTAGCGNGFIRAYYSIALASGT